MRAAEIVIGGLLVFFGLGLVAGAVLVIALSALRSHREAVRSRRMEQLDWRLRQLPGQREWGHDAHDLGGGTGHPGLSDTPPAPPPDQDEGPGPWPKALTH